MRSLGMEPWKAESIPHPHILYGESASHESGPCTMSYYYYYFGFKNSRARFCASSLTRSVPIPILAIKSNSGPSVTELCEANKTPLLYCTLKKPFQTFLMNHKPTVSGFSASKKLKSHLRPTTVYSTCVDVSL